MRLLEKFRDGTAPASQREATRFLILLLLAFLPYANTLFNPFVYDDGYQVVENPYAHSFHYLRQIFTTTVWSFQGAQGVSNYFRPMMTFGYLLTYQIAGLIPFSFHLASIALNALAVCLAFSILRRFSGVRVGFVAAGLFALHPIHTESVAWIAAVTDLELTVFYLATFLLFLRLPQAKNRVAGIAAMCACYALALLSKEQAMTLPVLAMLYEHFYRDDRAATQWKEKFSRYAPLWITVAVYIVARVAVMGGIASVIMHRDLSWKDTFLSAVSLAGGYLGKLLWPARLSAFYVFHPSRHLTDRRVLLGLAALALCAILFTMLWTRVRLVSFALIWMSLPLVPVLNARWMPASVFAERYLYLPSMGFCWLLGWGMVTLWSGGLPAAPRLARQAVPALLGILALVYAVKTVSRNRDWGSEEVLFRKVIETQGEASLIRSDLGVIAYSRRDYPEAERDWQTALAADPANAFALDNMALLRQTQHRYVEAADYSRRALQLRPVFTAAHLNLAQTFVDLGCPAEAESQFRTATSLSPLSTRAHNSYGNFLLAEGRKAEALAEFERSADADFNVEAYEHLGDLYFDSQDLARAEKSFRAVLSGNPFDSHAHFQLAAVLEATGRPAAALREYESGLSLDPTNAAAKTAAERLGAGASKQPDSRLKNLSLYSPNGIN